MAVAKPDSALADISRKIQQYLGDRTAREIAERTGVHPETVRRYLAGMAPSLEFVVAVCREFKLSADWLLLDEGTMHRAPTTPSLENVPVPTLLEELHARADRFKSHIDAISADMVGRAVT